MLHSCISSPFPWCCPQFYPSFYSAILFQIIFHFTIISNWIILPHSRGLPTGQLLKPLVAFVLTHWLVMNNDILFPESRDSQNIVSTTFIQAWSNNNPLCIILPHWTLVASIFLFSFFSLTLIRYYWCVNVTLMWTHHFLCVFLKKTNFNVIAVVSLHWETTTGSVDNACKTS